MPVSEVKISTLDGSGNFSAYLAEPESGEGPGVVLLQEIFGINQNMRDLADRYASEGYRVCVPDLFWRIESGVQLDSSTSAGREKAMEIFEQYDPVAGLKDSMAALAYMREKSDKVGVVGYCMGGRIAYHMAVLSDADCCVGYYGVGIDTVLDQAVNIKNPLILHIPAHDHLCPPKAQAKISEALVDHQQVALFIYDDAGHGFARMGGGGYVEAAANLADARTEEIFTKNLR